MEKRDRFRGSLIGGAAGDALGYAVEFMSEQEIFTKYGQGGITEYELENGKALISDDTQMTMFTATALLDGVTRRKLRGIMGSFSSYLKLEYVGWYLTQTKTYPLNVTDYYAKYSWIMNYPDMFSRRAPGETCLSALSSGGSGTLENAVNGSKGCGGIMRAAPIGLYFANGNYNELPQEDIDKIGAESAAITHGHELGYIPAAALVHIINLLAKDESLTVSDAVSDSILTAGKMFKSARQIDYFCGLMEKAVSLANDSADDLSAIHQLGKGWVAEETLAIAVYCSIRYQDDFEKGICAAVNHSGDSDSTGAVCGNILGAFLGYEKIPRKFKENLEFHNVLIELADDLLADCQMSEYGEYKDDIWTAKYINKTYRSNE